MTRTIGSAWFLGVLLTATPLFATDATEPPAEPLRSQATPAAADETANTRLCLNIAPCRPPCLLRPLACASLSQWASHRDFRFAARETESASAGSVRNSQTEPSSPAGTLGDAEAEPADALGQDATTEEADDDTQVNEDEPLTEQEQQAADEERQAQRRARQRAVAAAYRNPHAPGGWLRQGWTHFFAAEAGAARINRQAVWTGRLMLGPAFRREPSYFALPLMVDLTEGEGVAVGAGVDILSQKAGTFLTLGGLVDPDASGIFTASLGWQLFVVDLQVTARESARNSQVFFKLRLPISTLIRAITDQ